MTRDDAMFYVQRDADGQLLRVEAAPITATRKRCPADHPEVQAWFAEGRRREQPAAAQAVTWK
jgi:hypothetical protein